MEEHIEKMRAREQAAKDTQKQDRVTQALNLLIEHALTQSAMPIPKQYNDYHGNEWQQAWDYLNQYVIDRVYYKLQQYHRAVHSTLDVIDQPIYDRKFGQLSNCLTKFQQLAETFRDTHNLMETHRVYCDLHNIYKTDILPLINSIFNSVIDALPSAEIYISKLDTMEIIGPENLNLPLANHLFLSEQPKPTEQQAETRPLSNKGKEEATVSIHDLFDALLLSQLLAQHDEADAILAEIRNDNIRPPEVNEDDEDLATAIALSQNMTGAQEPAPLDSPDSTQEQEFSDIAAALSADAQYHNVTTAELPEDEQVSIAIALSMSSPPPPQPANNNAPIGSRFLQFFSRLSNRTAPAPPPLPAPPPAEESSSEDEVVKTFRNEFW